jgi:hypothetical protein
MHVYVQKSIRTTLPRSSTGVSGSEFNHWVARLREGIVPSVEKRIAPRVCDASGLGSAIAMTAVHKALIATAAVNATFALSTAGPSRMFSADGSLGQSACVSTKRLAQSTAARGHGAHRPWALEQAGRRRARNQRNHREGASRQCDAQDECRLLPDLVRMADQLSTGVRNP